MYIYANFLPCEQFHKVLWLRVDDGPWWYYTTKDPDSIVYTIETNEGFFESVDKDIRKLVKFLHGRGYVTTPSCAGHFRRPSYYQDIFKTLLKDQDKIRNQEVTLTTPNQTILKAQYQDPSYYLPWGKDKFIKEALENQTKGVLGIEDKDKRIYKAAMAKEITCTREGNITLLMESSTSKIKKKEGWDRIGTMIVDTIV